MSVGRTVLPHAGVELSRLGLGLSRLHYIDERAGVALIHAALDLGITHFDTARLYGDGWSEYVLGKALAGRTNATIATKCGLPANPLFEALGRHAYLLRGGRSLLRRAGLNATPRPLFDVATLDRSLLLSMKALAIDTLDIVLLHEANVSALAADGDAVFARLSALKQSGVIRAVGITAGGAEADAVLARYSDFIDIVQSPGTMWPTARLPDIQYGVLGAGAQVFGARAPDRATVHAGLRAALAAQPAGCVLLGTTKPANLRDLVETAQAA